MRCFQFSVPFRVLPWPTRFFATHAGGQGDRVTMRRQMLIALGAFAVAPRAVFAQAKHPQGKVWRIGYLYAGSRQVTLDSGRMPAFLQGMKELGYVEGKHFVVTARYAETQVDQLSALAGELVQLNVDVILTSGGPATRAAQ